MRKLNHKQQWQFEVCLHVLVFIVIGQHRIDLSESNQIVPDFVTHTDTHLTIHLFLCYGQAYFE